MAKLSKLRCWLIGCRGHVEHEIDADGVEWIGLRCVDCGKLKSRGLANHDNPPVPLVLRPKAADPRPFTIYRNRRGGPRWYQPIIEAWWVMTRRHSLHSAWQAGKDYGSACEYRRLIHNKAYLAEIGSRRALSGDAT